MDNKTKLIKGNWYVINRDPRCLLQYNDDELCTGWWNGTHCFNLWSFSKTDLGRAAQPAPEELLRERGVKNGCFGKPSTEPPTEQPTPKYADEIKLFTASFIQVFCVVLNTWLIANKQYLGVLLVGFTISFIWTFNVKKISASTMRQRLAYSAGAGIGGLLGLLVGGLLV